MTKIQKLLDESNASKNGSVAYLAGNLIEEAQENANQTVSLEKSAPESERDQIAEESLICLLSYCKDSAIIKWFAARGIKA
jgi:hypothetical protein